jgi:DNA polymerase
VVEPALHIDFETRGTVDLLEVGLHNYARHPDTAAWCMAAALDDAEPWLWTPEPTTLPSWFTRHVEAGGAVYAHNAPFELAIWNHIMVPRYGWPVLKPEQTYCTMAMAYAMGLPGSLEDAALAMGIDLKKDTEGRALMLRMCRPRSTKGGKVVWWDEPEKMTRLYEYCRQDVRVERELHKRLMPLSERERKVWLMDHRINQRGVKVDVASAKAAVELADKMKVRYDDELAQITNGAATSVTALAPLKEWLNEQGCHQALAGLAKADVSELLNQEGLGDAARAALTIRQESGKASNAKFDVMVRQAGADDRLRNLVQYHGAATGRWAGRAVQVHNLPRNMPKPEIVERVLDLVRKGEHDAVDAIFGPPLSVVSSCLRGFFTADVGKRLIVGDFSNVEGRGQAWFAGEEWKLEAFRKADAKTGPGLYELAYSRMFGVPVETIKNPSEERQIGKVAELAFGYQGGVGSFHVMGKTYGVKVSDTKANEFKEAWRAAHPKICKVWYDIQKAAIAAVQNEGAIRECGAAGRQAKFRKVGSFLWCLLPSGRAICYPYPKILEGEFGPQLTYMTAPSPDDRKKGRIIYDPQNTNSWARVSTYGGSLFNNIDQGMCRDILAETMLRMEDTDLPVVLHVHDEPAAEVDEGLAEERRQVMQEIMRTPPAWAKGFPLFAECNVMRRYGK